MSASTSSRAAATPSNGAGAARPPAQDLADPGLVIPDPTELIRLNYFDGKFLRADDLRLEQDYLRRLVWLSNRAGGSGVVYGLDLAAASDGRLEVGEGLAIDPAGRVLFLPHAARVDLKQLVDAARGRSAAQARAAADAPRFAGCEPRDEPAAGGAAAATDLYRIDALHAEARCGQEDVYGKLCESACAGSTAEPYLREGIVLRVVPLSLRAAACSERGLTDAHLRSQAASAYFADERRALGRDLAGVRLRQPAWCTGAAGEAGEGVPLAVAALRGGELLFVDEWTARRERMADPALRWWQWQAGMRPLAVFWAQVLQFQCQLARILAAGSASDPGAAQYTLLRQTREVLAALQGAGFAAAGGDDARALEAGARSDLSARLAALQTDVRSTLARIEQGGADRVLIERGITELPPAGWLPVEAGLGAEDVNAQVRRLLGGGVELRFCAVRPDYVAQAFQAAQHLERICLLEGLANPALRPEVDVLVPGGRVVEIPVAPPGRYFETVLAADLVAIARAVAGGGGEQRLEVAFRGAGRGEAAAGGGAFHFAGIGTPSPRLAAGPQPQLVDTPLPLADGGGEVETAGGAGERASDPVGAVFSAIFDPAVVETDRAVWMSLRTERDPFSLARGESTQARGELLVAADTGEEGVKWIQAVVRGDLVCSARSAAGSSMAVLLDLVAAVTASGGGGAVQAATGVTALLRREAYAGGGAKLVASQVKLTNPAMELPGFTVEWSGGRIEAGERIEAEGAPVPLEEATLAENPDVALAGNPFHTHSLDALALVRGTPELAELRARARQLLFPPLPPPAGEISVRATTDWVLFHRRRRSSCDCCPPGVAAPTRRYVVWHAPDRPETSTQGTIHDVIAGKVEIPEGGEHFVERLDRVAAFLGGGSDLITPADDVLQAWRDANPGETLVYAAITGAGTAAGDPDALLAARLRNLVGVVGIRTPAEAAELEVVPQVAELFDASGADGVIVLVTRAGPRLKHRVLLAKNARSRTALLTQMGGAGVATDEQLAKFAVRIGEVEFREDQPVPAAQIEDAVKPPPGTTLLTLDDKLAVASRGMADPVHVDQAAAIAGALKVRATGGPKPQTRPGAGNEAVFGDALAVTIFAAA